MAWSISLALIPSLGFAMFVFGGIGAFGISYARKSLPESPNWLGRWITSTKRTPFCGE